MSIDWQIWTEDGRMKLPRKVVIAYKRAEGTPLYTPQLSKLQS
ncbi:MAG: DUF2092 domain-containing protein [Candidatus Scalindua sp. AMX11]|nr:MAG: DUF2092 domain-containing protein [Candidatus Scalindua sp.]NOG84252.1 DUF2092 domain-containing protein [Planctomycetota bacterium]RZV68285.1 MAG: DUF2092 domain-containing protein [Candidatus Scalindua sp. SCAELEC01]TDE63769.1 MAG: DUF2092 domain-containing protein [Candidatus Scalindua sp. AMX11]